MSTHSEAIHPGGEALERRWGDFASTHVLVPIGRVLFALIFVLSGATHFAASTVAWAASQGVPYPGVLVPFSGALAVIGGLSVALGWQTRVGALLLVLFLVPVTLTMHAFWNVADPVMAQVQRVNFLKNVALLGATLLLLHHGAGPVSLDARRRSGERRGRAA